MKYKGKEYKFEEMDILNDIERDLDNEESKVNIEYLKDIIEYCKYKI